MEKKARIRKTLMTAMTMAAMPGLNCALRAYTEGSIGGGGETEFCAAAGRTRKSRRERTGWVWRRRQVALAHFITWGVGKLSSCRVGRDCAWLQRAETFMRSC